MFGIQRNQKTKNRRSGDLAAIGRRQIKYSCHLLRSGPTKKLQPRFNSPEKKEKDGHDGDDRPPNGWAVEMRALWGQFVGPAVITKQNTRIPAPSFSFFLFFEFLGFQPLSVRSASSHGFY